MPAGATHQAEQLFRNYAEDSTITFDGTVTCREFHKLKSGRPGDSFIQPNRAGRVTVHRRQRLGGISALLPARSSGGSQPTQVRFRSRTTAASGVGPHEVCNNKVLETFQSSTSDQKSGTPKQIPATNHSSIIIGATHPRSRRRSS